MDSQALYDLSPLARLMLMGVVVALGPLAWVWLAQRRGHAGAAAAGADAADAVPDLRPGAVRRLHPPDRLGPGLPGLARLLRQRQPGGCQCRHHRSADRHAHRPGDAWQGLGRDDPPLPGHRRRRADPHAGRRELGRAAARPRRLAGQPLVAHADPGLGLPAGRVRCAHRHHEAVPGHRHAAPARRPGAAGPAVRAGSAFAASGAGPGSGGTGARPAARVVGHGGAGRGCRSRWAAGSAPTTPCWPAAISRCARAAGGRRWTSRRASRSGASWACTPDGAPIDFRPSPPSITCTAWPPTWCLRRWPCWPGACSRAGALRAQARWLAGAGRVGSSPPACRNVVLDWPLVAAVLHTGGAAALVVVLTWALAASRAAARRGARHPIRFFKACPHDRRRAPPPAHLR